MPSIRLFLTLTIIAIITLVNFLSTLRGYRESMAEAETLFDEQLLEYALMISAFLPTSRSNSTSNTNYQSMFDLGLDNTPEFQSTLVFQVFDIQQTPLINFNTGLLEPVTTLNAGYSDVNFDGYRWHALTYFEASKQRWIITAQRDDIRYTLAERVILESVLPIVIGIPITGLIVWLLIGMGLRPINRLANELTGKEATDLSPVDLAGLPKELKPLKDSTNELLKRLQASFDREKRFAADAAHELRTPISILKVQMHNLLQELDGAGPSAQQLKLGIDRMGHLVEQILDLNKTAPDLYMAQFEQIDLYELCQEVVSECYPQFLNKNQHVELLGNQTFIKGDRFAITTLMKNLLGNASKYTPEQGEVRVHVAATNDQVSLSVTDNGPGIPAEERGRALERFYRVDGDRHGSTEIGCGLGLAIVKHIVDLHRADIVLTDPESGRGLCVTIDFKRYDGSSINA